jgi:beta-lactamase class A
VTQGSPIVDEARARLLDAALDRFVAAEPGRSIAVDVWCGPSWSGRRDGDVVRPAASLLKIAIVMAVYAAAERGAVRLDQRVRVDALPPSRHPGFIDVLDPSHELSVRELCGLAMATSDNPVADRLLAIASPEDVNEVLGEAGCTRSRLAAGFSDDELGDRGRASVTTAADMLRLLRRLHDDPGLHPVQRAMESSLQTIRVPSQLPDDGTVRTAHKTGSLQGVVNDAGIVTGHGIVLAVAVLCDDQRDSVDTSVQIGDCVRACWDALTEGEHSC